MSNLHIPSTGSMGSANSATTIGSTHPGGDGSTDGLRVRNSINPYIISLLTVIFFNEQSNPLHSVPLASDEPPEQLYRNQLEQLESMGFVDQQANIRGIQFYSINFDLI